jgi:hypothetical protein
MSQPESPCREVGTGKGGRMRPYEQEESELSLMHGKHCCEHSGGPWISAYQIALKYGFRGSEAEWVRSIGTMRVANVTGVAGGTFQCDTSLGQIRNGMEDGYLTALVYEGIPAFVVDVQDDYVSWATNLLRDENGDYYDVYTMSGRSYTVERMRVSGSSGGGGIGNKAVHINNLDDNLAGSIALANSAVQPEDLEDYVPVDVFRDIEEPSADLIEVKRDPETGRLYVLGTGSPAPTSDNTRLITMTGSGSNKIASMGADEIHDLISDNTVNLVLIDVVGRECLLIGEPMPGSGQFSPAKFATIDDAEENIIVYSVYEQGIVSESTIPIGEADYGTANAGKPLVVGSDGTPEPGEWQGGVDPEDITEAVEGWLEENIDNPSNPPLDKSLLVEGAAADAKATREAVDRVFYQSAKMKLIEILRGAAYTVSNAPQLIDELEAELFPEGDVVSIEAVYTQDGAVVYAGTPLDALRADLVVTATLSDESTKVITDYTLTGTLAAGTSTVTVHYRDLTDTFSVTVTAAPTEVSITALYTQGSTVVTPFTPLNSLKNDLVVMVNYSNTTSRQLDPSEYTLSGTLTEGTSTIDVAYNGFTDEFTVTVGPAPSVPTGFDTTDLICCLDGKQINDNLWYNLVSGLPFELHNVTVETDGVTFDGNVNSYAHSDELFANALTIEVGFKAAADAGNYGIFMQHQESGSRALALYATKSTGKIFTNFDTNSETIKTMTTPQIGMLSVTRRYSQGQVAVLNGVELTATARDYSAYPDGGIDGSYLGLFKTVPFKGEILYVCLYSSRKTAEQMQANQAVYDAYYNMGLLNQS